jgi:hypothetical protein
MKLWISVRSSEMLRDMMQHFCFELRQIGCNVQSYASMNRVYLYIDNWNNTTANNKILDAWVYYNPISMLKRAPDTSNLNISDW